MRKLLLNRGRSLIVVAPVLLSLGCLPEVPDNSESETFESTNTAEQALAAQWLDMREDWAFEDGATWNWMDSGWYSKVNTYNANNCSYKDASLKTPFVGDNAVGTDLINNESSVEKGWTLYTRRILNRDDLYRSGTTDERMRNCMAMGTFGTRDMPYFMLYNTKTGVMRTFAWMGTAATYQGVQNVGITLSVARDAWTKPMDAAKETHDLFQLLPRDGIVRPTDPRNNQVIGSVISWSSGWVVFDTQLAYDPSISSKSLFFNVEYRQHSEQKLSLSGTLSPEVAGDASRQRPGVLSGIQRGVGAVSSAFTSGSAAFSSVKSASRFGSSLQNDMMSEMTDQERATRSDANASYYCQSIWCKAWSAGGELASLGRLAPWAGAAVFATSALRSLFSSGDSEPKLQYPTQKLSLSGTLTSDSLLVTRGIGVSGSTQSGPGLVPYFSKSNANVPLGLFRYTRSPRMALVIVPGYWGTPPSLYYVVESLEPLVQLNPSAPVKIAGFSVSLKHDANWISPEVNPIPGSVVAVNWGKNWEHEWLCHPRDSAPSVARIVPCRDNEEQLCCVETSHSTFEDEYTPYDPGYDAQRSAYFMNGALDVKTTVHFQERASNVWTTSIGNTHQVTPQVLVAPIGLNDTEALSAWLAPRLPFAISAGGCQPNVDGTKIECKPGRVPSYAKAVTLHRSVYNCNGSLRGSTSLSTSNYYNYTCTNRYQQQCIDDGTFDQYYLENCDYAPIVTSM